MNSYTFRPPIVTIFRKAFCEGFITYITFNCFNVFCNIPFKKHLPEDGNNSWPKHVTGHAVYATVHLHISTCTCWSYFSWRYNHCFW